MIIKSYTNLILIDLFTPPFRAARTCPVSGYKSLLSLSLKFY